ncbi:MAG: hypothetical protein IPP48_15060 [Chitinophagaceae bacterium]|nr:hypothetical protein [Chitinophagaceae bacterium]
MKKLLAIVAVAGVFAACNPTDDAAKAAEQATADSLKKVQVEDSIKAAAAAPVAAATDSLKAKVDAATDSLKAKVEGAAKKVEGAAKK